MNRIMRLTVGQPTCFSSIITTNTSLSTLAVDGLLKTFTLPDGQQLSSCASTNSWERDPWWAVDLGMVANVAYVTITTPGICTTNVMYFRIFVRAQLLRTLHLVYELICSINWPPFMRITDIGY